MIKVAAVVVTYDRPRELTLVIAALKSQTRPPDSIIVVDNHGPVDAASILAGFSSLEIVRSAHNRGGAGGFAFGLQSALVHQPDWIWLMDDDAVPRPTALAGLIAASPGLPDRAGVLSPTVYEEAIIDYGHQRRFCRTEGREAILAPVEYERPVSEIDLASFVGFFVRAQVVHSVGLPNEAFFLSYDDTEYSLRIKKAGWSIWHVASSAIDHLRPHAARLDATVFGVRHYYDTRNRIVCARMYSARRFTAGAHATRVGRDLFRVTPRVWRSYLWFARAILDGWLSRLGSRKGGSPTPASKT